MFFSSKLNWSVRSDWTPLPVAAEVYQCTDCSHLFKPTALTKKWSDYQNYHVLDDNPEMDKLDFNSTMPVSRSTAIINFLREKGYLKRDSKVLDYGCNRGAFLKLLDHPGSSGYDVSEHYRPVVEKLGCDYYTPQKPPPKSEFDLLTLVHVAEHLDPFSECMKHGLEALKPSGVVFIQVPEIASQPTDLYVMDHCSHFYPETLDAIMATAGLKNIYPVCSILKGEQTAVYVKGTEKVSKTSKIPKTAAELLKQGEDKLLDLAKKDKPCVVFGAGLIGAMIGSVLKSNLKAFVDDNPALQGKTIFNSPVKALNNIKPSDGTIVVAVPPSAAQKVENKCLQLGFDVVTPYKI